MSFISDQLAGADGRKDYDTMHECHVWGAIAGAAISYLGSQKSAKGTEDQGKKAKEKGREQQTYNEMAAAEVMNIGRMNAAEDKRQARLIASRAVAVAAAGGAVEDIEHLLGDIYGEGAYRASISLMDAQSQSSRLLFEGEQAAKYGAQLYESAKGTASAQRMGGLSSAIQTGTALFGGFDFND